MLPSKSDSNVTVGMIYAVFTLQRIWREKQRLKRRVVSTKMPLIAGGHVQKPNNMTRTVSSEVFIHRDT